MMFACFRYLAIAAGVLTALSVPLAAGQPKLDAETCVQLRGEQVKFVQSGILADLTHGPEWGKVNLSADRLREIEHYIMLDEQLKFACREAVVTPEAERAAEIAKRLEINSDADPTLPLPTAGSAGANDDGAKAKLSVPEGRPKARKSKPSVAHKPAKPATTGDASSNAMPVKSAPVAETPAPAAKDAATAVP